MGQRPAPSVHPEHLLASRRRRLPAAPRRPGAGVGAAVSADDACRVPRPRGDDAAAARGARGHAAVPRRSVSATRRAPTAWPAPPAGRSTTPARRSPPCSAAGRARSCSPAAAPRPTTSPCSGVLDDLTAEPGAAVCPAAEHHAVLDAVESVGGRVVGVDATARVDLDALAAALDDDVAVVSVMLANNEIGVVDDLGAVADVVRERARVPSCTPTPCRAPAGSTSPPPPRRAISCRVTAPQARRSGGHRRARRARRDAAARPPDRRRPGARPPQRHADVAGAVALATALRLAADERTETVERVGKLRDRLADGLRAAVPGLVETAASTASAPTSSPGRATCACPAWRVEAVLFLLDEAGICASAASSCASGAQQASHVLAAMGIDDGLARGSLRFSLGPDDDRRRGRRRPRRRPGGRRAPAGRRASP